MCELDHCQLRKFEQGTPDLTAMEAIGILMGNRIGNAIRRSNDPDADIGRILTDLVDELGDLVCPNSRLTPALLHETVAHGMDAVPETQ